MPEAIDVDVAIIGGGCAGLSLAARLADGGPSCLVLEARSEFANDRTWCFWDRGELARWGLVADASWDAWSLRFGGQEIEQRSPDHRYVCLSAQTFFRAQSERIRRSANVQIHMNSPVAEIVQLGGVSSLRGRFGEVRARQVFDTRPPVPRAGILLQHFAGWEVETLPVFDPSRIVLMDFDVHQANGIHFLYLLPFSRTRALVEATVLSLAPWPRESYQKSIRSYLSSRFGVRDDDLTVVRRETAVLPMSPPVCHPRKGTVDLGSRAGAAKISTGYAFPFIQRQADAAAASLLAGRGATTPPRRSALLARLDALFVSVLKRHPHRAPEIFDRLFRATTGAQFARFMMDEATLADLLSVIVAMPPLPFLQAAASGARA